ncbi:hypothetical protein FrEUN1fDRAFT_7939, partial [Parafrankia sp. EUN1f]
MGPQPIEVGSTGERVRRRVTQLRKARRLTLVQLSERLTEIGR